MTLKEFLKISNTKPTAFSVMIGCCSQFVYCIANGKRKPSHDIINKVMHATNGAVMPQDWFDIPEKFLGNDK